MTRITTGNNGITQKYNAISHKGVDIGWHSNEDDNTVIAHTGGIVVWVQRGQKKNINATGNASYGNAVKIKHPNGYYTLYAHLKGVHTKIKVGATVAKGQELGKIGETGKAYGRHLHFEVRNKSDVRINPTQYINADLPNTWYPGMYTTLKSKYIRKTPEFADNKIVWKNIDNQVNKKKSYADKNGYAKTKVGVKFELTEFTTDKKGNIWGKLQYSWICVQDSTGKQVK